MQKNLKKDAVFVLAAMVAFLVLLIFALPAAAAVTVYAEGAYTGDDLVVYVYADIDTDAICSAGVKLTYDNTVLTVDSAEKNDAVWFMGAGGPDHSYMNPEVDADNGTITIICGKLDTEHPADGVLDTRVLLGTVTFTRKVDFSMPGVNDPEGFFGISVELGRVNPFANFVTANTDPIVELDDAVEFYIEGGVNGAIVRERGDANADGLLNVQDILRAKTYINAEDYPVYVDCNRAGGINVQDLLCIKSKL